MAIIAASAEYRALVRRSHQRVCRVDVWYDGRLVAGNVAVTEGEYTVEDDALIRASISLTIVDEGGVLVPDPIVGGVNVYGHQLHVRAGIVLSSGFEELFDLGWFVVEDIDVVERFRERRYDDARPGSGGATLRITARDRAVIIDDARFTSAEIPGPGAKCLAEVRRMLLGLVLLNPMPFMLDPAVPADLQYQESRLEAVGKLVAAANCRSLFDRRGIFTVQAMVDPAGKTPDISYGYGYSDMGGLLGFKLGQSRADVYNGVVARGEQTGDQAPVQAIAIDSMPGSVTRWGGPFGRKPLFYASPMLTTTAQCQAAAQTRLDTILAGRDRLIDIETVPDVTLLTGVSLVGVETPRWIATGLLVGATIPLAARGGAAKLRVRVPQRNMRPGILGAITIGPFEGGA